MPDDASWIITAGAILIFVGLIAFDIAAIYALYRGVRYSWRRLARRSARHDEPR